MDASGDRVPRSAANGETSAATTGEREIEAEIRDVLRNVDDPELGINIVDLGLVYDVSLREGGFVTITMTLTTPGCPMHESIGEGVGVALSRVKGITGGEIRIVWEPRWTPARMSDAGRAALGYW